MVLHPDSHPCILLPFLCTGTPSSRCCRPYGKNDVGALPLSSVNSFSIFSSLILFISPFFSSFFLYFSPSHLLPPYLLYLPTTFFFSPFSSSSSLLNKVVSFILLLILVDPSNNSLVSSKFPYILSFSSIPYPLLFKPAIAGILSSWGHKQQYCNSIHCTLFVYILLCISISCILSFLNSA